MNTVVFSFFPQKIEYRCEHNVTNVAGRECCDIYGKMNCDGCLCPGGEIWSVMEENGSIVFCENAPVRSSLGWLYGYPTKISQREPLPVRLRRQGTTTFDGRKYFGGLR